MVSVQTPGPGDAYLRVRLGDHPRLLLESTPSSQAQVLTFLDLDAHEVPTAEDLIAAFQRVPHRLVSSSHVLIRWPHVAPKDRPDTALIDTTLAALAERPNALPDPRAELGIVQFVAGGSPQVRWARALGGALESALLARARAAELGALLERGHAIWAPRTYHYRLPSGLHDRAFVRLADALLTPRDARALATWVTPRLGDLLGVLVDSGTLIPLVLAVQAMAQEAGFMPGPVVALDDYPRTRLEIGRAARDAAGGAGVLGLLSVSSSGALAANLADALRFAAADREWWLEILIDKQADHDTRLLPKGDDERRSTWLGLRSLKLESAAAADCRACREHETARIVQIDPRNFGALLLPEPELIVPSTQAAASNADFWTIADSAGAIAVEAEPDESVRPIRPKGAVLPIRVVFDDLLRSADLPGKTEARLRSIAQRQALLPIGLVQKLSGKLKDMREPSAVVTTPGDRNLIDRCPDLRDVLLEHLGADEQALVTMDPGNDDLPPQLASASKLLVLTLGSVSGWTLRQFAQRLADVCPDLHGLVVHARPATVREWQSTQNVFRRQIVALWLTYLPWDSPLSEELDVINPLIEQPEGLAPPVLAFLQQRRFYCAPEGSQRDWRERQRAIRDLPTGDPRRGPSWQALADHSRGDLEAVAPAPTQSVLWGHPPFGSGRPRLRGRSLYGNELGPLATYAAVGAAVHEARMQRAKAAPQWQMFEMPALARSYFDGSLVATMLRWMRPQEVWWGATPLDIKKNVSELVLRFNRDEDDLKILLPELLLAGAQGKVPKSALDELRSLAGQLSDTWDDNDCVPVEAGQQLLKRSQIDSSSS